MNDSALIRKLKNDSTGALEALIRRYTPYVSACVYRVMGSLPREEPEEAVADAFVELWRHAGELDPERGPFGHGWPRCARWRPSPVPSPGISTQHPERASPVPLGVALTSTSPNYTQIGGYPLTVFLSDGTSFRVKGGDVDWVAGGSTAVGGLVEYDPEAKTVLMVGGIRGDGPSAERLILGLDITEIQPGARHEDIPIDPAWIAGEPLQSLKLENGKSVLAPDQNPRELDSEFFSLSSFGFGEDGVLHLQFRVKEGVDNSQWEKDYDDVRYSGGSSRSDTAPYYLRTSRYVQSTNYKGMTAEERELASPHIRFQKGGVTYYDSRTGITPNDVAEDDVEWVEDASVWLNTRPAIKGEWSLDVPVEMVEKVNIDMAPSQTVLADVEAVSLHLSVLGCTLESDPYGAAGTLNYPLTVYLSDGSILPIGHADGLFHAGGYAVNHWSFPEPVEPGEVTAVAIGLWYVPIQDGTAQPGYWLPELPK